MGKNKAVVIELEGDIDLTPKSAYDAAKADGYLGTEEEFAKLLNVRAVTQEEFDAIPGRLVKMTNTTDKADFHHITDSVAGGVIDFGMEGMTEQKTTDGGKNKLDTSGLVEQTINGVTFTPYYTNGLLDYILVNGTASSVTYYYMNVPNIEELNMNNELKLTGCPANGSGSTYRLMFVQNSASDIGNGVTIVKGTIIDDERVAIRIYTNTVCSNLKFYPMVRLATETDATYEPFTNGPTPNPDFPQEIVNAGRKSKNLWNNEIINDETDALVNTPWDGYYAYPVYIGAGNPFVVSFVGDIEAGLNFHAAICLTTSNITKWLYTNTDGQPQTQYEYTGIAVSDYIWISISHGKEDLFAQYIGNVLQIELGSVTTEYEPYSDDYKIGCGVATNNLIHFENLYQASNNPSITVDNDIISVVFNNAGSDLIYDIDVPPYTYITLSAEDITAGMSVAVETYKISGTQVKAQILKSYLSSTIYTAEHTKLRLTFYSGGVIGTYVIKKLLLNSGQAAEKWYGYHQSTKFTLTSPVPLTKWDYLTKRDGVWGWSIWQLPLSVSATNIKPWVLSESLGCFYCECLPYSMNQREGFCNQLTVIAGEKIGSNIMYIGNNNKLILVYDTNYHDETLSDKGLANWKAHLNEHPLEIVTYADTEQAFHPLPEEEQELLKNLETYYGVTNVYNEQGCPMWLTYVQDMKTAVDNKFNNIRQALVSLGANV